jgi:hypothetical protein
VSTVRHRDQAATAGDRVHQPGDESGGKQQGQGGQINRHGVSSDSSTAFDSSKQCRFPAGGSGGGKIDQVEFVSHGLAQLKIIDR